MPRAAAVSLVRVLCLGEIIALEPRDANEIYIKKRAEASPFFRAKKNLCN
jgi:hypothetical protein